MKIFRYISLLLIGLAVSQAVSAQTVLTGVVRDKATGQPLVGANVYINTTSNRAVAGATALVGGEYRIQVPTNTNLEGAEVVFSFVGYKSASVAYTGQRTINMDIESEARAIESVTVVARAVNLSNMGIPQTESTAATDRMSLENLETAPVTNVVEALQGALAGVDILTGADPGSKSSIRIRGTTTFNTSAEPLIVVDNVPFPVDIDESFDFATATEEDYGQLLNISPTDMASIEILKDAAGAALYGSRGANGVVVINLKKGAKGRMSVSFSSTFEVSKEANTIPLLNGDQYVALIQDAIWNTANSVGLASSSDYMDLLYNTKEINYDPLWANFNEYNQNTDWVKELKRTAYKTDNNVTVSGGGDKTTYRLSLGYLNQTGTMKGVDFDRYNASFNLGYRFSDKLRIDATYKITRGEREANYHGNERSKAINKMPNQSPYRIAEDGSWSGEYFTPYENFQGKYSSNYNPIASVNEAINRSTQVDNSVNFMLEYKIIPGLTYTGTVSAQVNTSKSRSYLPVRVTGLPLTDANYNRSADNSSDQFYLYTENKLIYNKNFGSDHRIIATGAWTTSEQDKYGYSSAVSGNASPSMIDPVTGGIVQNMGSSKSKVRSVRGTLNLHYTLMNRYIISGGYTFEANAAMGPDNRWGAFPNVGVAWKLHEESFMESISKSWLDEAKLRVNWGITGTSPKGVGAYLGAFTAVGEKYMDMGAIQPVRMQLNNLKYQTLRQISSGIDLSFLQRKLNMSVEYYDKMTRDMLQTNVSVPSSTGYGSVAYYNSGKLQNRGWELTMEYKAIEREDWKLSFRANISQNESLVKELPSNASFEQYTFGNGNYASKVIVGDPFGSFYGHRYQGVYGNLEDTYMKDAGGNVVNDIYGNPVVMRNNDIRVLPGDAKYEDVNGDGKIDQYDVVYLGNSYPEMTGGLTTNLSYKNLGLSFQFQGRWGQKAINATRMSMENMRGSGNQSTKVIARWRKEGDEVYTDIPRALYNYGYNYLGSDRFVEDASFIRLKWVTLKYSLPRELVRRWKMNQLQVYVTAYDLWTITDYTGQDPEVGTSGGLYPLAKDGSMTPKGVRVLAGLRVTF